MKSASFSQAALEQGLLDTLNEHFWGTIGPVSTACAQKLAELTELPAALLCSSHAAAAETVLRALEVSYGDEVILPAVCSPFLKETVEAVGAKAVFCDVDETLGLDPGRLSFFYTDRTQAIFCEEVGGYPCAIDKIAAFAKAHDLPLIDVTADPYNTRLENRPTVTYADFGVCLFPLDGVSAIVTDEECIAKLYAAHHCGNPYGTAGGLNTGVCLGGDMRVDEFRSFALSELLSRAEELRRQKNSLRIRITEALLDADAAVLGARDKADTAGDYVFCATSARETCRDKASELPCKDFTEQGRVMLFGVRAYKTLPENE